MFRSKKYNKDFEIIDEKKRYKLYKSGKNWVKASNSQLDLFRIGGMGEVVSNSLSDTEELDHDHLSLNTLAGLGGILAAGAAGLMVTQEQSVYADETSEYTDKAVISAEVKDNEEAAEASTNSIIAQAQAEMQKAKAEQASESASISVEQSVSTSISTSESVSFSLSTSQSVSQSISQSVSASSSASVSQSVSASSSVLTSNSSLTSKSVSAEPATKVSESKAPAKLESANNAASLEQDKALASASADSSASASTPASLDIKVNVADSFISSGAGQSLASATLSNSQALATSNNLAAGVIADKNQAQGKDALKQAEKSQTVDKTVTTSPKESVSASAELKITEITGKNSVSGVQSTSVTTSLIEAAAVAIASSEVTAKQQEENRRKLTNLSAEIGDYLAKAVDLPNTDSALAKANAAVTEIEKALTDPTSDLTTVLQKATSARNSIVNAVLAANSGVRDARNGTEIARGAHSRAASKPPTISMPSTITIYNDEAVNNFQIRLNDDKGMAKITPSPSNAIITGLNAPNYPTNKKGVFGDLYIYDQ